MTRALREGRSGAELKKSDVWSLGICSYILLTGCIPFTGNTMVEVLQNIHCRNNQGLRTPNNCHLKRECIDLLNRLLCIDVEARMSAKQALKHPFITGSVATDNLVDYESLDLDDSMEADISSVSDDDGGLILHHMKLKENTPDYEYVPHANGSGK